SGLGTAANFSLKNGAHISTSSLSGSGSSTTTTIGGGGDSGVSSAPVGTRYVASPISIPSNGGQVLTTTNANSSVMSVYADVQQDSNPSPSGLAVRAFTQNGVIVSEAGVPASAPVTAGRIYVNVDGPLNTGIAFANANQTGALISFYFTDLSGNITNQGSFLL